jgi:hypothetical protein
MPDINHPLVASPFATGATLDADRVSEGLHNPKSAPDSMSVINGRLDEANLAAPYSITNDIVRPGAMATASTSGQTTNLDFFSDFFFGDYDPRELALPYPALVDRGLTAVAHRFYVPYDCSLVSLHWHVGIIVDGGHKYNDVDGVVEDVDNPTLTVVLDTSVNQQNLMLDNTVIGLFLDGNIVQQCTRHVKTGRDSMLGAHYIDDAALPGATKLKVLEGSALTNTGRKYWNVQEDPDHRWWSGHYNATEAYVLTKGWHTASIRVTNGKRVFDGADGGTVINQPGTTDPLAKVVPHVRFKTCNMTAIPIR